MKRLLLAALVWLFFVGGVAGYMHWRDSGGRASVVQPLPVHASAARFDLELTPSFRAAADPFALNLGGGAPASPLRILLNGQEVPGISADALQPGRPFILEALEGVRESANELFVEASPETEDTPRSQALRLRLLQDGAVLLDETRWSPPGGKLTASLHFRPRGMKEGDSHGH